MVYASFLCRSPRWQLLTSAFALQGLMDFSADVSQLKVSQAAKDFRRVVRVPLPAFDQLQVVKYVSARSDVISKLLYSFIPWASTRKYNSADALVLWLLFEEKVDFESFTSETPANVKDWWSELVLFAHDRLTTEVRRSAADC